MFNEGTRHYERRSGRYRPPGPIRPGVKPIGREPPPGLVVTERGQAGPLRVRRRSDGTMARSLATDGERAARRWVGDAWPSSRFGYCVPAPRLGLPGREGGTPGPRLLERPPELGGSTGARLRGIDAAPRPSSLIMVAWGNSPDSSTGFPGEAALPNQSGPRARPGPPRRRDTTVKGGRDPPTADGFYSK